MGGNQNNRSYFLFLCLLNFSGQQQPQQQQQPKVKKLAKMMKMKSIEPKKPRALNWSSTKSGGSGQILVLAPVSFSSSPIPGPPSPSSSSSSSSSESSGYFSDANNRPLPPARRQHFSPDYETQFACHLCKGYREKGIVRADQLKHCFGSKSSWQRHLLLVHGLFRKDGRGGGVVDADPQELQLEQQFERF